MKRHILKNLLDGKHMELEFIAYTAFSHPPHLPHPHSTLSAVVSIALFLPSFEEVCNPL